MARYAARPAVWFAHVRGRTCQALPTLTVTNVSLPRRCTAKGTSSLIYPSARKGWKSACIAELQAAELIADLSCGCAFRGLSSVRCHNCQSDCCDQDEPGAKPEVEEDISEMNHAGLICFVSAYTRLNNNATMITIQETMQPLRL